MTEDRQTDEAQSESEHLHEEQFAYRGLLGDVCAYEPSNKANPELCGNEGPIVDKDGNLLVKLPGPVPHSAPKK
jgi:hypothetical protein